MGIITVNYISMKSGMLDGQYIKRMEEDLRRSIHVDTEQILVDMPNCIGSHS